MYNIAIWLVWFGVWVAGHFSKKIATMRRGEGEALGRLREWCASLPEGTGRPPVVWFHAASLGEFEQGRPLMEDLRRRRPEARIVLTFFSPSGYEVRKDYRGADIVCYLPIDTPANAKRLVGLLRPEAAYFIKYEFWYNYIRQLHKRGCRVYSVSSIFRPGQIFFRWWGRGYAKVLRRVSHFFVQNEESRALLQRLGIHRAAVVGDTRFDRVLDIRRQAKHLPIAEAFAKGHPTMVAGSSWEPDEDVYMPFFARHDDWRLIVAPHVVSPQHIERIRSMVNGKCVCYTSATPEEAATARCLIIDCYGLLSSVYQYGQVAYVGGGFGVGIHNVLEAAVWDMPVVFGPNNKRFREALGLIAAGGAMEIASADDFEAKFTALTATPEALADASRKAGKFVESCTGATKRIMEATQ